MSSSFTRRLLTLAAIGAITLLPAALVAQAGIATESAAAASAAPTVAVPATSSNDGPRITQSGVTRAAATERAPAPMRDHAVTRDVAWMIVGGAALVVGSMVGGDGGAIIMITGGVIGLVGLFRFIQHP